MKVYACLQDFLATLKLDARRFLGVDTAHPFVARTNKNQQRVSHGNGQGVRCGTPSGFEMELCSALPGCAARPWALG